MKIKVGNAARLLVLAVAACAPAAQAQLFGFLGRSGVDANQIDADAQRLAQSKEEWMRPMVNALYRDGEWGAVLNLQRLGLAAMEKQNFALARRSFDEAIARVEAIYADNPTATKARSVFNGEKVKDFKGEPYERAMLYFYRGLLYVEEGDFQNARAAFLAADRHDTLSSAEDKAFVGKFGLMKYMAGWASSCEGDTTRAKHLLDEARAADTKISALPLNYGKSLVLIDAGPAPVKYGDGPHKEVLKFRPGEGAEPRVSIKSSTGRQLLEPSTAGDIFFQASTRGGREIDGILAGKASFKDNAGTVGEVGMATGQSLVQIAAQTNDRQSANLGMAAMLVGLVAKAVETAANPAADVRAWDTLPAKVLALSSPTGSVKEFRVAIDDVERPLMLQTAAGGCALGWIRTGSALPSEHGGTAHFAPAALNEDNRVQRNKAFRAMVSSELLGGK